jgi:hypothetical protein
MRRGLLALVALGLASAPAYADARAEAIVLFDQGIKDMKAGRLDKACAALRSSLDLVKDSGTKGALARCHGLAGRIATAWLLWRELADTAPTAALRSDAALQAAKLEPRLPRYTLTLARSHPDLVVEINGRRVATNVSVAVPIDPGKLRVSASRRDGDRTIGEPWVRDYTAVERQIVEIEVPALVPIEAVVDKPARPRSARSATDESELAERRHRRHLVAGVLGGVALGGAAAGTWFGLQARSRNDEAKGLCGDIQQCPAAQLPAAKLKVDSAKSAALTSTLAFTAAGAVAVVATIVWVTAPSSEPRRVSLRPAVGPEQVGLVVGGAF